MSPRVWYPITSGVLVAAHAGFVGSEHPRCALVAWLTKPSILPPLTSAVALVWPCGPPPFTSALSTNGLSHLPVFAFGMHGDGLPFVGIPLAFGYVPK